MAMKKEGIQTRKRKPKAGGSSGTPIEKQSNKSISPNLTSIRQNFKKNFESIWNC